jgi:hypothetical protein
MCMCLFYLAIRQIENFLPRMVHADGALTSNKDPILNQAKSSVYRKVTCDLCLVPRYMLNPLR